MPHSVAIAGASGYAGGELLRLLAGTPQYRITAVAASSQVGQTVGQVHPNLAGDPDLASLTFTDAADPALRAVDLLFLALPHGQSAALVEGLPREGPAIVDLGADFRLRRAEDWASYYAGRHAGSWTYGLPELPGARSAVRASRRVANPGCYATSVILALEPALTAGLVDAGGVVVTAASGTSGAGRAPSTAQLASEVMGSMSAYKVGGTHQHTPEIEQALGQASSDRVRVSFTPFLAPMPRGIIASSSAPLLPGTDAASLRSAYAERYADEPFVHLLPEGTWPRTADVFGSNAVHMQVAVDTHAGRAVVISVLDNLVKGAAGQALQNANLMLGLAEEVGLTRVGVAP